MYDRELTSSTASNVAFRLFVESVVDYAIFTLDKQGTVTSWNKGAQRAKGYTADEIIGQHFSVFYTAEDRARKHPEYELAYALKHGRYEEEGWRVRKDGTLFWANVIITAVFDEDGTHLGFGKVTRDLTERREQQIHALELERQRATAEASNKAKTDFLTTMSHELRTPLNAILGYMDVLEAGVHGELNEQQLITIRRVRRSSRVLLGLINDVLNIARIEAGHVDYRIEDFALSDMLRDVEIVMAPQFEHAGIDLKWDNPGDLRVRGDYEKWQQVLLNLLSNSLKFTPAAGHVSVDIEADDAFVRITVRDSGRGIPDDKLEFIFDRFVQVDRHLTPESHQGAGLGLAISRELARAMGGDVIGIPTQGGATLQVSLPRV
jgi:PAS domain S-box-containing protein